jgi:hypothetical protein
MCTPWLRGQVGMVWDILCHSDPNSVDNPHNMGGRHGHPYCDQQGLCRNAGAVTASRHQQTTLHTCEGACSAGQQTLSRAHR